MPREEMAGVYISQVRGSLLYHDVIRNFAKGGVEVPSLCSIRMFSIRIAGQMEKIATGTWHHSGSNTIDLMPLTDSLLYLTLPISIRCVVERAMAEQQLC